MKIFFKNDGEIKSFSDEDRELVASRPPLKKYAKGGSSEKMKKINL